MRLVVVCSLVGVFATACAVGEPSEDELAVIEAQLANGRYSTQRFHLPPRTAVYDANGHWVATFTDGARTVRVKGPSRTLHERTAIDIRNTHWVRVLDTPFGGTVDVAWLDAARVDTSNDVIARALQYAEGAPPITSNTTGLQIAGDASYGPLVDGARQEGSDFNDYLGIPWTYSDGTRDTNEAAQLHSLDCSGFMRMVWGYRHHVPLTAGADGDGRAMPRRAVQILASGPGVVTIDVDAHASEDVDRLFVGDLVFFDASTDDGTAIDHVGMYLGIDVDGHPRFISSRKSINGPTFGDFSGASTLDGTGLYARSFRAARRL
ncbi:MAG TPA: NlpC/P60 family protein [Kofleriaceae bacterium]|nr:NlpC/P60 family protein [Kofleriaceae bacterium]